MEEITLSPLHRVTLSVLETTLSSDPVYNLRNFHPSKGHTAWHSIRFTPRAAIGSA
jgi:hypothetical protein